MIQLGLRYKDQVSNFQGIATAICEYLSGETWVFLENDVFKDDEYDAQWFNEKRLTLLYAEHKEIEAEGN